MTSRHRFLATFSLARTLLLPRVAQATDPAQSTRGLSVEGVLVNQGSPPRVVHLAAPHRRRSIWKAHELTLECALLTGGVDETLR